MDGILVIELSGAIESTGRVAEALRELANRIDDNALLDDVQYHDQVIEHGGVDAVIYLDMEDEDEDDTGLE